MCPCSLRIWYRHSKHRFFAHFTLHFNHCSRSSSNTKPIAAAVGGAIVAVLLLLLAVAFLLFRRRRRMRDISGFSPVTPATLFPAQRDIEKLFPTSQTIASVTRKPVPRYDPEPYANKLNRSPSSISTSTPRLSTAATVLSWDPSWASALVAPQTSHFSMTQGSDTQSSVDVPVSGDVRLTSRFSSSQPSDSQSSAGDNPFADNSPYLISRFSQTQASETLALVDEKESDPFADPPTSRMSTAKETTRSSTVSTEDTQVGFKFLLSYPQIDLVRFSTGWQYDGCMLHDLDYTRRTFYHDLSRRTFHVMYSIAV